MKYAASAKAKGLGSKRALPAPGTGCGGVGRKRQAITAAAASDTMPSTCHADAQCIACVPGGATISALATMPQPVPP